MARTPVLFNRAVEVPAGQERRETILLTNNSRAEEQFQLSIVDGDGPVTGSEVVVAEVNVPVGLEESLTLLHRMPASTPPGVHPFTVVARLRARDLVLRLPGLMTVPPVGGWKAEVEMPEALLPKDKEGEAARGEAADPELRPWQGEAVAHIVITNHSSDWLYCDLRLENENKHWEYRLASQRVSLPPWSGAHSAQAERAGEFTRAFVQGLSTDATPRETNSTPPPQARIPLVLRPKKRQWFGKPADGTAKSNLQVRIARINPETGEPEAAVERPLRLQYAPLRNPIELAKPLIQKLIAFAQFAFSKQGMLSLAGIAALAFTFIAGPANVYYKVREGIWPPKIDEARFQLSPAKAEYHPGDRVGIDFSTDNADRAVLSGLPDGAVVPLTGERVTNGEVPALGDGRVEFIISGRKEEYEISLEVRQERDKIWFWEPRSKVGKTLKSGKKLTVRVVQKPIPVPDVVGKSEAEATRLLEGKTFVVNPDQTGNSPGKPKGAVLKQDPPKGTKLTPGSTVTLVINGGATPPPPPVTGRAAAEVRAELEQAGHEVGTQAGSDSNLPPGSVIRISPANPAPGQKVTMIVNQNESQPGSVSVTLCETTGNRAGKWCKAIKQEFPQGSPEIPSQTCTEHGPPAKPFILHLTSGKRDAVWPSLAASVAAGGKGRLEIKRSPALPAGSLLPRLVVIGPDRPRNAATLATQLKKAQVPVLGIGTGGLEVLSRIETEGPNFFTMATGPAEPASRAYAIPRAMRYLFTPDPVPSWVKENQQIELYRGNGSVVWIEGGSLWRLDRALLTREASLGDLNDICAGLGQQQGYWGLVDQNLSPPARAIYNALVEKLLP